MRTQPVAQSLFGQRQSALGNIADSCAATGDDGLTGVVNEQNIVDTSDSDMEPTEEEEDVQRAQVGMTKESICHG